MILGVRNVRYVEVFCRKLEISTFFCAGMRLLVRGMGHLERRKDFNFFLSPLSGGKKRTKGEPED